MCQNSCFIDKNTKFISCFQVENDIEKDDISDYEKYVAKLEKEN